MAAPLPSSSSIAAAIFMRASLFQPNDQSPVAQASYHTKRFQRKNESLVRQRAACAAYIGQLEDRPTASQYDEQTGARAVAEAQINVFTTRVAISQFSQSGALWTD